MDNPLLLIGVLALLLTPAYARCPLLLLPVAAGILTPFVAPAWTDLVEVFAKGGIAVAAAGYALTMLVYAMRSAEA